MKNRFKTEAILIIGVLIALLVVFVAMPYVIRIFHLHLRPLG
jgi:hypothetical protein